LEEQEGQADRKPLARERRKPEDKYIDFRQYIFFDFEPLCVQGSSSP
jgi:hypothetical protein